LFLWFTDAAVAATSFPAVLSTAATAAPRTHKKNRNKNNKLERKKTSTVAAAAAPPPPPRPTGRQDCLPISSVSSTMTEKIQAIEKQLQQQLCIFPESRKQQRTTKLLKTTKTCELLKTEEDIRCVICKFGLSII
jgi:hypothetical protein